MENPLSGVTSKGSEFFAGANDVDNLPLPFLPEILFVGKSNVGKS